MTGPKGYESQVRFFVEPLVQQSPNSCWYSASLMLLEAFRNRYNVPGLLSPDTHLLENPKIRTKILKEDKSLPVKNIAKYLGEVGFESRYTPVNPYLVQDMLMQYGPLMHVTKRHARVITGVSIIDEQNAELEYINPWDGTRNTIGFNKFFITNPGLTLNNQHNPLLIFFSPTILQPQASVIPDLSLTPSSSDVAPDAGVRKSSDAGVPAGVRKPSDAGVPAGVPRQPQAFTVPDLSDRIRIVDFDEQPLVPTQSYASTIPGSSERTNLSEMIKVLQGPAEMKDFNEGPQVPLQSSASTMPGPSERTNLSEMIKVLQGPAEMKDFDEGPQIPLQHRQASTIPGSSERTNLSEMINVLQRPDEIEEGPQIPLQHRQASTISDPSDRILGRPYESQWQDRLEFPPPGSPQWMDQGVGPQVDLRPPSGPPQSPWAQWGLG